MVRHSINSRLSIEPERARASREEAVPPGGHTGRAALSRFAPRVDDELPPTPAVEVSGELYVHLPIVLEALDNAGQRAVEHVTGYDIALGNFRRRVEELRQDRGHKAAEPSHRGGWR